MRLKKFLKLIRKLLNNFPLLTMNRHKGTKARRFTKNPFVLLCVFVTSWQFLFLHTITLHAQDTIENSIEQKLENIAESSQNEETDYTNLLESIDHYKKHPINLNSTNTVELSDLGLLDEIQIENLLEHIEKNGKLLSVYELQSIDGFDVQTIQKILDYIKVEDVTDQPHVSLKEMLMKGNHQFTLRGQQILEDQKGFSPIDSAGICSSPNSRYIGSPQHIYTRYRFNYGSNLSLGFTADKDPGELFFKKNNHFDFPCYDTLLKGKQKDGFDFYSAHFL